MKESMVVEALDAAGGHRKRMRDGQHNINS
jgi:hypothetical protein